MKFSPYPFIAVVIVILIVNLFFLVRFLIKANSWGKEKDDRKGE
jgi:hypothetical protein